MLAVSQMPWRSGCPSGVRGATYPLAGAVLAAAGADFAATLAWPAAGTAAAMVSSADTARVAGERYLLTCIGALHVKLVPGIRMRQLIIFSCGRSISRPACGEGCRTGIPRRTRRI